MKALGHWLAETRVGRTAFRLSALALVLAVAVALFIVRGRDLDQITKRIEVVEQVEPVDVLRECLRTPKCRNLFRHPERVRPERRGTQASEGVVASSGNSPSGQPSPGDEPGDKGGPKAPQDKAPAPRKPKRRPPRPPASQPAPQGTPSASPPPEPQPGNSDETPGAGKGLKACVELIVSECIDGPRLLP